MLGDIDLKAIPHQAYYVRRRRTGSFIVLVHGQTILQLDDVSLSIWDLCDGVGRVVDIIASVQKAWSSLQPGEIVRLVHLNLGVFLAHQFITFEPPRRVSCDELLDACDAVLFDALLGFSSLPMSLKPFDTAIQKKLLKRIVRILWETKVSSESISEDDYRRHLTSLYLHRPVAFIDELRLAHRLVTWHWIPDRNQVELIFQTSVYRGDLDSRR